MMNKKVLTIAGSDSSGGAGIQADLKVMSAYGVYGMSVITAVTAQNTLGVQRVEPLRADLVRAQLQSVLEDIRPDAVKIGMVYTKENIKVIAEAIDRWNLKKVVVDPMMISTSNKKLLRADAMAALEQELFPRADLVTPNLPEAQELKAIVDEQSGGSESIAEITLWTEKTAAKLARHWHTAFLIKGGHSEGVPADYCDTRNRKVWFPGQRIETVHTHGTGCTLSAAIACNLAKGLAIIAAVEEAKEYLTGCIRHNPGIGRGHGPLNHGWRMEGDL